MALPSTQRVLRIWTTRDPEAGKTEAAVLRQAIADADWNTVERHGGIDATIRKVLQVEDQLATNNDPGMIDDIHLAGSRTWRRMGGHLTNGEWLT